MGSLSQTSLLEPSLVRARIPKTILLRRSFVSSDCIGRVYLNETANWIDCDVSSAGKLAAPPHTPLDGGAVEQAHMLQPSIGNQAMLRLLARRDTNLAENDSPDRLTQCGSVPMISGWSHAMWVPSQIMWADVRPQSQLIWARIRDDLAPRLRCSRFATPNGATRSL
jgi:hypothetical protein